MTETNEPVTTVVNYTQVEGKVIKNNIVTYLIVAVCILSVALSFMLGKNYQSVVVDNLAKQNQDYQKVFVETEKTLNQLNQSPELITYWNQIGYKIKEKGTVK